VNRISHKPDGITFDTSSGRVAVPLLLEYFKGTTSADTFKPNKRKGGPRGGPPF